jgi:DNA-binding GntR family transcriptional regulator
MVQANDAFPMGIRVFMVFNDPFMTHAIVDLHDSKSRIGWMSGSHVNRSATAYTFCFALIFRRGAGVMASLSRIVVTPDLTEQVYQRLLHAICDGELAPDARLTQEDLAAALGVSRQPVLQALRLLKKDGFVSDAGRRGLRVTPFEASAITQMYEVRAVLDGLAARRAALAHAQLDPAILREGRQAVAGPHIGPMIDADMRFHHLIYTASGNPLIAATANQHWHHIRRAMGAVLQTVDLRHVWWDEHEAILQAISSGEEDRAERLARQHCEGAGYHIAAQLTPHGTRAHAAGTPGHAGGAAADPLARRGHPSCASGLSPDKAPVDRARVSESAPGHP